MGTDYNIIILCRHGERIDCTNEYQNQRASEYDPELTKKGNELSKNIGIQIANKFKSYIDKNGIKLYCSPFTRTLETALSMRNEMDKIIPNKTNQELIIVKDLGEINFYSYDIYPTLLYYLNGKKEKGTKLYEELIMDKIKKSNVKYDLKHIDYGEVLFPEGKKEADLRYINFLKKIMDEIKDKMVYLIIIVTHGEGVSACSKYLYNLIKVKDEKEKISGYFNKISGGNQKYCNSVCFKITKNGEVHYCCNILPNNY